MRLRMLLVTLLAWPISNATANDATVALANRSWIAYQCAYYANAMIDGRFEADRLNDLAYSLGKSYFVAVKAGHLKDDELVNVPIQFTYPGPNFDYILGAVSVLAMDMKGAQQHATDTPVWAEIEYKKRNCQHV